MGDNNSISGVEPIEPDKVPPLPGADQESGAGMGGVFSKVYLLRPKIKCNSPHSRPKGLLYPKGLAQGSGQTPRRR